jgi:hypothetical protein
MADKRELEDQVARLTTLVEEMRTRMARLERSGRPAGPEAPRTRRDLLKLGGAAALGAVGAAALRAVPAAAADGGTLMLGQANVAESPTLLTGDGASNAPVEVLGVQAEDFDNTALTLALGTGGAFGAPLRGHGGVSGTLPADVRDGVDGWASGDSAFGVYGLTDTGVGVTGESGGGVSLYARGSGRILQDPHTLAAGVPDYIPGEMEQVRDSDGTLWLSNSAGVWRRASTFEVFPNPRRVYGLRGVLLAAGATVANIDATRKLDNTPTGVPQGVVAAWCAVQSVGPGVLSIYPSGSADPHSGAYAQSGLAVQLIYIMVPLNSTGHFTITNMRATRQFYIDVWGYLSQSV